MSVQKIDTEPVQDIRDLVAMRSKAAYCVAAFFTVTCVVCAIATRAGMASLWPVWLAVVVLVGGVVLLIVAPGDPLRTGPTVLLTLSGPIAAGSVFAVMPVPMNGSLQTWPLGMSVVIFTFMCVRGRTLAAWIGLLLTMGTALGWTALTGQGWLFGLGFSAINIAPLLMATFFAFTIRPLGAAIFELRKQSTLRIASEAATSAALEERDARLASLDALARPLLQRIADGPDPTDEDILACTLLEADLRDSLRARGLMEPSLARAARAARGRGVEVMMLDDRGTSALDVDVRSRIVADAVRSLDAAGSGSITIRVLPPGRPVAVTILIDDHREFAQRLEFDHEGTLIAQA